MINLHFLWFHTVATFQEPLENFCRSRIEPHHIHCQSRSHFKMYEFLNFALYKDRSWSRSRIIFPCRNRLRNTCLYINHMCCSEFKFAKFAATYFQGNVSHQYSRKPLKYSLLPLQTQGDQLVRVLCWFCIVRSEAIKKKMLVQIYLKI
jgi:hypothetical protein